MACLWADESIEIDGFEVERELGRGGMGRVYLARQQRLDRTVALKLIAGDGLRADQRRRFEREARVLARLVHPNIVALHEYGESGGAPYLVMEHVDGGSLAGRTLAPREAVAIAIQVCDALACAHAAGIVHRDIKPSNILLDARGTAKVVDFGIARALGDPDTADLTKTGVVGTPLYMAPELAAGAVADTRSDVYSVGVALFQLIAGRAPVGDLAVPLPRLEAILRRALAADPAARYQTAAELGDALRGLLRPRRRWPIAVAVLGTVGVGAAVAIALRGTDDPAQPRVAVTHDRDEAVSRDALAGPAPLDVADAEGPAALGPPTDAAPRVTVTDAAPRAAVIFDAAPRIAVVDATPRIAVADAAPHVAATDAAERDAASAPGTLVLRVRPWAMVAIDGSQVQRAEPPSARIVMSAGRHHVDLHNPTTDRRWSETVDVPAGGERVIEADLR